MQTVLYLFLFLFMPVLTAKNSQLLTPLLMLGFPFTLNELSSEQKKS